MDIREELKAHRSKERMMAIVAYIGSNKKRFHKLMEVLFKDGRKEAMYAAWTMCHICDEQPHLMQDYWDEMLGHLEKPKLHPTEIRSIVRTWRDQEIPKRLKGTVIDKCFHYLLDEDTDVAVKVYAMTLLVEQIEDYPDLRQEFIHSVEEQLKLRKASLNARARMCFKKIGYVSPVLSKSQTT